MTQTGFGSANYSLKSNQARLKRAYASLKAIIYVFIHLFIYCKLTNKSTKFGSNVSVRPENRFNQNCDFFNVFFIPSIPWWPIGLLNCGLWVQAQSYMFCPNTCEVLMEHHLQVSTLSFLPLVLHASSFWFTFDYLLLSRQTPPLNSLLVCGC